MNNNEQYSGPGAFCCLTATLPAGCAGLLVAGEGGGQGGHDGELDEDTRMFLGDIMETESFKNIQIHA